MSSATPSSAPSITPLSLPPTADRFSAITQDDQAGYLWIATLLAAIYAILSILVRSYVKRDCFGKDDLVCVAATVRAHSPATKAYLNDHQVLGTSAFVAIFVGLGHGLGKSSSMVDATQLQDIGEVRSIIVSTPSHPTDFVYRYSLSLLAAYYGSLPLSSPNARSSY